ncbi:MAG: DUF2294 domain-containing protein [Proteobacteria bacterium]|nr:DUF2294 domain-containing protein [Pseudomonadota bacterium]
MTKGQVEAEISNAMISFEKEHMGRGPVEAKTFIIQDIVVIRLRGVLTPAEIHLAKDAEGIQLIKQVRTKLLENAQEMIREIIEEIAGVAPISLHTDISTKTGERFIIVTVAQNLENSFL